MKRACRLCVPLGFCILLTSFSAAQRLPAIASPESYRLTFAPDFSKDSFSGVETIQVHVLKPTPKIVLNALDLDFHEATITVGAASQRATVTFDKEKEQATLAVGKTLRPGPATIEIKYTGKLSSELRGFYLGKQDDGHKYAATQFEATDARRAFPCFDEPAYKATFNVTVIADQGMTVISNAKAISDEDGPAGKHTVRFAVTPQISSYLVAFVVGNFEYIEGLADGIPIRVYTTPGKKELGRFALETAEKVLPYYDHYFGIKYPYSKLDLVGLSDFGPGAMENAGCITFREVFLMVDDKRGGVERKKFVGSVVAHEISHQWFGDLVTMQWWDDVWLNEGFADWMASKPLEAWHPEWEVELSDVRDSTQALGLDALQNTHPIHQQAETAAQILQLADAITYGKAAAVLRMLESYLGEETFRAGVSEYLKEHAYGNAAAADFWNALAQVSKKPVDKIMATFVEQAGAPLVSVKMKCQGQSATVSLEQQRYYYDRAKFESGNNQLWEIPVCFKQGLGKGLGAEKCQLLTQKQQTFTVAGCSSWINANAGAHGFYRSGYDAEGIRSLAKDAERALSPTERIMLLSDLWASVRVDREKIGDYLVAAKGLQSDRQPEVVSQLMAQLDFIGRYLVTDADRESYRLWVRDLLSPVAKEVGWQNKPGESEQQEGLRNILLGAMGGVAGDPEVQAFARQLVDQALEDPSAVDRELAGTAFPIAASNGDAALFDQVLARLKSSQNPEERAVYRQTLEAFSDPKLLARTLEYAINEARSQDATSIIGAVMRNPAGQKLGWDFVRAQWGAIEKRSGAFGGASAGGLVASTGVFCDPAARDEVKEFFAAHPVASAERALRQSLERIDYCIDLKSRQAPELASWLQEQGRRAGN
jgi:aminopeptidase N